MAIPLHSHDQIYSTQNTSSTSIEPKDPILLCAPEKTSSSISNHGSDLKSIAIGDVNPSISIAPTVQGSRSIRTPGPDVLSHTPKTSKVVRSPECDGFEQASVAPAVQSQNCQLQIRSASLDLQSNDSCDALGPSTGKPFQQHQNHRRAQSLSEGVRRDDNLKHPPGYIQNPYAMEMTAEQRLATAQENQSEQCLPMPNSVYIKRSSAGGLWRRARRDTGGLVDIVNDWLSDRF